MIKLKRMKKSLGHHILIVILFIINSLITVGEWTKLVCFFPFKVALKSLTSLLKALPKFKKLRKKLRYRSISVNFLKVFFIPFKLIWFICKIPVAFIFSSRIRYFLLGSLVSLIIVFSYQSYKFIENLPSPYNIGKVNYSLTTHILDRNGRLLYEVYRNENRTPVSLSELPDQILDATVAVEDKDFYKHKGVSLFSGIIRAAKDTIVKKKLQGGSTITQQLVKSSLLTPERTIQRKLKEIILALWAEKIYNKRQILEMYLNQVAYGGASYGIQEAAKTYFGKTAKELTLDESALLAGLPQAPSIYSPYINPDLALIRRNEVLKLMKNQKYINTDEYQDSIKKPLNIIPPKTTIKAPHFVFYVKQQLEDSFDIRTVEEGGLKVTTTLDLDIQNKSAEILKEELEKFKNLNVTNGAVIVIKPSTGEILAMVGSSDYFSQGSGAFNITTALRQPGSSIKPLMYSLALERGYTTASIIDDSPIVYNSFSESYRPLNYDNKFHGKVPLRYALANSFNVPAVKVLDALGVTNFVQHAESLGITTWNDPSRFGLSLTLGGGEVKMTDMATAFGVFANMGDRVDLNSFLKVEDINGQILSDLNINKKKVLNPGVSYIISDILADNKARSWVFGSNSLLNIPGYHVSVKTGTTNSKRDNWTIGYTPNFLVAVWVGNNDNSPMSESLESGATGAAPIWNKIMTYILKNYQGGDIWFKKPENIVEKNCYFGRREIFITGTEKSATCREMPISGTITPTPSISTYVTR